MSLIALYPGSFDPFTNGHLGITKRALNFVDELFIGIACNARKQAFFSAEDRIEMIREIFAGDGRVKVCSFQGLTVEYAASIGASVIVRGLRGVADFEYELQMANMNRKLSREIETLFMMTSEKYFFVSSQNVKEVARLGGSIDGLVPPEIARRILEKLKK
jgi:pantetheine-phosphate adenylyltransferase